ncbi:MAG: hypothetical protein B7O98_06215 [Zestosphaera tikiterensis]|uniref:Riboflavin kinase n=1 Tax=Zestosphaera tikiterensis TaxID=1973259 RepID=A0A2R7Y4F6_9CREN|nr:MAG: hypothetical protein B7O98_06215 [Zestosphaera tikiterensis]
MYLVLRGEVVEGFGVGAKYVTMPSYNILLTELLDGVPYPGTLNIRINSTYEELVKNCTPSNIKSIVVGGEERGGFYYWFGEILGKENLWVLVTRPHLSKHEPDIIEVLAEENLREKLSLRNGSEITLKIYCGELTSSRK